MLLSYQWTIYLIPLISCILVFILFRQHCDGQRLPPGPNLQQISAIDRKAPWKSYKEWSGTLGPVICTNRRGPQFVLNTAEAVFDLLERRSRIYSSRPPWPMVHLLGRTESVAFTDYGEQLKQKRKLLHGTLGPQTMGRWEPLLHARSIDFLKNLLVSPEQLRQHVQHLMESTSIKMTYGHEISHGFVTLANMVNQHTSAAFLPGRWLLNTYPILACIPPWFPGATSQRWARDAKNMYTQLTGPPYEQVKKDMVLGTASPSFVRDSLEASMTDPHQNVDENIIKSTAGSLYSAAVDTTAAVILTFFIFMARHPDVQERAYSEIKSAVGLDRVPELKDRDSLPYVDCVIKEVLRIHPPVSLVAHSNSEADEYNGYYIPKKSWVVANAWALLHDEKEYPDPERFHPERFLESSIGEAPRDPRTLAFGYGRRACPGFHFANALLYIVISRSIALFSVKPIIGSDGQPEFPALEFSTGLVSSPKPFRCIIDSRKGTSELLKLH